MLLGSHGGAAGAVGAAAGAPPRPPGPPARGHDRTRLRPCAIGQMPVRSGSPQAVFGWTQPFGVSMKWLASLGATPGDWACTVTTKTAAAPAKINRDFAARLMDDIAT